MNWYAETNMDQGFKKSHHLKIAEYLSRLCMEFLKL